MLTVSVVIHVAMASSLYGYVAALVSCVAFGSFAVPIKGEAADRVHIDPLVMQTYKTVMCFITCWAVLFLGERFTFTPWGLASGLFWVPGGTAGIYAVRNAGLAVSQGTWSTLKIMVAFVWGVFIFDESVRSRTHATMAILLMMVGLWGMSYFSSPEKRQLDQIGDETSLVESLLSDHDDNDELIINVSDDASVPNEIQRMRAFFEWRFIRLSRRQVGLLCATIDGVWGGSILVPMHFARKSAEGLGYVISFAIGAVLVLILMWIFRFSYHWSREASLKKASNQLPSFHFSEMWLPGGLAGLLWSIGNVCSILTVTSLGEGVGYSMVQAQMLIAGLWGILWYREIKGARSISAWFLCACVAVTGIVLFSHEHVKK